MAAIVYQKDKRSNITYAYESISYWDKEKQQSRAKRKLIGRVDQQTGEIVPTDGRGRKKKEFDEVAKCRPRSNKCYQPFFLWCDPIFSMQLVRKLESLLTTNNVFRHNTSKFFPLPIILFWKKIICCFVSKNGVFSTNTPMDRPSPPNAAVNCSQRLRKKKRMNFSDCRVNAETKKNSGPTTPHQSPVFQNICDRFSMENNKENDRLPQFNLAMVFGETSNLPFYYRKLAGNIPDSKTIRNLLADLDVLGFSKVKLVMDRGFYSEANINSLYKDHLKFLIAVKTSLTFVRNELDKIYDGFRSFDCYSEKYELYAKTVTTE